jgi:hypothetical protein
LLPLLIEHQSQSGWTLTQAGLSIFHQHIQI